MGLLRVILALSVVLFHSGGLILPFPEGPYSYSILGGNIAVQGFYILSGFYMALILHDKYTLKKGGLLLFYTNRVFRLMPLYFLFLLVAFALSYFGGRVAHLPVQSTAAFILNYDYLALPTKLYLFFSNIFIVGHDLIAFLGIDPADGSLFFTSDWTRTPQPFVLQYFFIPQAWTLSLEIYFYLMVPFIIRRLNVTVALICISFLVRMWLYNLGYDFYSWRNGLFFNELALFLLGTVSYRFYLLLSEKKLINDAISIPISAVLFFLTFFYPMLPQESSFPHFLDDAQIIYFTAITLGLPFLFHLSKNIRTDRFIGELSYPMYLCHFMIVPFFGPVLMPGKSKLDIFLIVAITMLISFLAVVFVQRHVENYREKRVATA